MLQDDGLVLAGHQAEFKVRYEHRGTFSKQDPRCYVIGYNRRYDPPFFFFLEGWVFQNRCNTEKITFDFFECIVLGLRWLSFRFIGIFPMFFRQNLDGIDDLFDKIQLIRRLIDTLAYLK